METIEHFSHHHRLKHSNSNVECYRKCYCCLRLYSSNAFMYVCVDEMCRIRNDEMPYLCSACARLKEFIDHHVFHPQHPRISLVINHFRRRFRRYQCAVCRRDLLSWKGFYRCDDYDRCDFIMHVQCAHSVKPVLALPLHNHSLVIVTTHGTRVRDLKCEYCHCEITYESDFARCVPCNLNYHIYCERGAYKMPVMCIYPQRHHPQHRLSLRESWYEYLSCDVCGRKGDWPRTDMYVCLECDNFKAHLSCFFQSLPCPFSRLTRNNIVDMRIKDSSVHEDALCQGCKKSVLNGLPIFGCKYCNFFIHESCIQQPVVEGTMYNHPGYDLRRKDPLALVFAHGDQFTCACCDIKCSGFIYQRESQPSFVLDVQCMFLVPSLELIGHQHPVIVMHERNTTKTSYLRCTPCCEKFIITQSHCLLPRTLLHECHFHPLTLVPRLVDVDGCYCDVCEGMRDPDEYIYYCGECKFETHITCVKSEVLGPSCNKLKNVEFINLYEIGKAEEERKTKIKISEILCLDKEVQYTFTLEKELEGKFQEVEKMTLESFIGRSKGTLNKILYSDDPFIKFIEWLNSTCTLEKACSNLKSLKDEDVVRVGEYLVPFKSERVFETLFSKYGDIGAQCKCSSEAKQYLFVGICRALQNMYDTKVARVTEDMLVDWWIWCAMGNAVGFRIQFAIEIWKRAMYAHFGLEADKYADGKLTKVRKEMRELPREIDECTKKLENARRELENARRKLEEATAEEEVLREAAFRVKKSNLMNKCLKEAEDLVCYSLGEMLFPPLE